MTNKNLSGSKEFLDELEGLVSSNNRIKQDLFDTYNVKRGLRNKDGTGVLVGLTEIGDVHGYIVDENEKVPDEGRLRYRGIDINDIVKGCQKMRRPGFEEVAYLLIFGELPSKQRLDGFMSLIDELRDLPNGFIQDMIIKVPSSDLMNKLARSVLVLYSYDQKPEDRSMKNVLRQCIQLIAQFPRLVAYGHQAYTHHFKKESLFIHHPKRGLSTAENFLHLIRDNGKYTRLEAELLDLMLILHAEHGGGNNSTFTTRVVASADTDVYSSIAAGIGSLKGLKHGGANIKMVQMMEDIKNNVKDFSNEKQIEDHLAKIVARKAFDKTGLIYGLGHAVYTKSDPRAELLKKKLPKLAKEKGCLEELELYNKVEDLGPQVFADIKGSAKNISANVDFYSGFVYRMLGIPVELLTPIFAVSRVAGWSAHIVEEKISGGRIIRPAYKNVAPVAGYIPLNDR
ncbi:MAG: citrate/2-methylcitrate synthase [Phycisphaerae bacterium]|nr:citrate/2-methylcitrate synthase [Phycisphaerae bacterium]